jgi:type VI secretion system protein ImpL
VRSGKTAVDAVLNESDLKGWGTTLQKWLPPPFESVNRIVNESSAEAQANEYCEAVYKKVNDVFLGKYPFVKRGRMAKLKDFTKFFKPETGELWEYYNNALSGRIPRKHGTFAVAKTGAGDRTKINPQVIRFLNRAADLSQSMFPTGSEDVLVEFQAWIEHNLAVAKTTLTIDGTTIEHVNGPLRYQPMKWPGEGEKGAEIKAWSRTVRGGVKMEEDWGLFLLMEEGTPKGSSDSEIFTVRWDLTDQDAGVVVIKFKLLEENSPFYGTRARGVDFLQVFRHPDLRPPAQLYIGGKVCAGGKDPEPAPAPAPAPAEDEG